PFSKWRRSGRAARTSGRTSLLFFEVPQLRFGVDVAESVGLVVERDFGDLQGRIPRVDLAAAALEKSAEAGKHAFAAETEYRVRLIARARDGELSAVRIQRRAQSRNEVRGQERGVARHGRYKIVPRLRQSAMQACKGSRVTGDRIRNH